MQNGASDTIVTRLPADPKWETYFLLKVMNEITYGAVAKVIKTNETQVRSRFISQGRRQKRAWELDSQTPGPTVTIIPRFIVAVAMTELADAALAMRPVHNEAPLKRIQQVVRW